MALFNKKNQTISEIEEYYASKKTRNGMAWVMALGSLLITIGVMSLVFFGGRWVYRTLADKDKDEVKTVTTTEISKDLVISNPEYNTNNSGSQSVGGTVGSSQDFPSVVTDQAASTSVPSSVRNSSTSATAPSKGSTELPDTGAGETLVIFPLLAVVIGYFLSRKRLLNR
ncbi:MAG: hypothetical protein Q7T41_03800 [Candidatus Saccharibacteria bacterium]|nr:hypothetical protein [Candidatus Saccharibacteria bacterium]